MTPLTKKQEAFALAYLEIGNARRRAEAEYGITVDRLTDMYMEIYDSSDTRPAGKMQAIVGLAKLHGFI